MNSRYLRYLKQQLEQRPERIVGDESLLDAVIELLDQVVQIEDHLFLK